MSNMTFQQENDRTLNFILDKCFFEKWKNRSYNIETDYDAVELYITSECNLNCEYCYLAKFGEELYPSGIRNHNQIIANLRKFLDWTIENDYQIPKLDLFSGEIWGTDLGNRVFDTLLEYLDRGFYVYTIMIPSNTSFILNDKQLDVVDKYIAEFMKRKVTLLFSSSVDGLIIEEKNRPFKDKVKNKLRDQEFYDKLFTWAKKHRYGFHPMVNAYSIDKWVENFDWWAEMFSKYNFDLGNSIMFLEVRNDDWDKQSIGNYLTFLNHVFDCFKSRLYRNDTALMAADLIKVLQSDKSIIRDYCNIGLNLSGDRLSCSAGRNFTVRLGDLAIAPCHRVSYEKFHYGKFIVENDRIVGIQSKNIQFAIQALTSNFRISHLGCDVCVNKDFCIKGCYGSQFESMDDPFIPIKSVCDLFLHKTEFLIKKYQDAGLLKHILTGDFDKYNKFIIRPQANTVSEHINRFQRGIKDEQRT